MPTIGEQIRDIRTAAKLSREAFAQILGEKPSKIQDVESGRQRVNDEFLLKLAAHFTVDMNVIFGLPSETEAPRQGDAVLKGGEIKDIFLEAKGEAKLTHRGSGFDAPSASGPASAFAWVPLHEVYLSAGGGCLNSSEEVSDYLAFRRDWLRRVGVAPERAKLAKVRGDSMSPTLFAGDLVLIDEGRTTVTRNRKTKSPIYAFVDEGEALIKRIEQVDTDVFAIMSDNREYPMRLLTSKNFAQLNIIGQVIWWAHTANYQEPRE